MLVCDDGSTDDSASVAQAFEDRLNLKYSTGENFGGPARPRNRGIEAARGCYVAFLDSDDWWAPEKLEKSVAALDAGCDAVYHDLFIVRTLDQVDFPERILSTHPRHPMFESLLCTGISIPNSSVVVSRKLLEEIGGISECRELISVEDYDTWIRLARVTERFVRLDECLGYYWVGGGNISVASPKQQVRIQVLYKQYLNTLPKSVLRRANGFLAYRIGRIAQQHGDLETAISQLKIAMRHPIEFSYRVKSLWFLVRLFVSRICQ